MHIFREVPDPSKAPRPPKHLLTREQGEAKLNPHLGQISECITVGWKAWDTDYKHKHHILSARSRASIIFDEITAHAEKLFRGRENEGIVFRRKRNLFLLYIGDSIVLRFKKIDRKGRCSSINTRQQFMFMFQAQLPTMETGTMVHAGYALNDLQSAIEKQLVVCQFGRDVLWNIELRQQEATNITAMPAQAKNAKPKAARWKESAAQPTQEKKKSTK